MKQLKDKTLLERLLENVEYNTETGCLLWQRNCDSSGYGSIRFKTRTLSTHRVAYTLLKGNIASGACVMHTCDTPNCVQPSHLFAGTQAMNIQDCKAKGRYRRANQKGSANNNALLTEEIVLVIKKRLKQQDELRVIAQDFNISYMTVWKIHNGRTWGWLSDVSQLT